VDCIHTTADDPQYYIDPNMCIDCAACEPVCPVSAIFFEDDVPEDQKQYTAINAEWFEAHDTSGEWRARTERHDEAGTGN
jgi:formate hydrogenlyase subunit 6/NADH:ubiquinone oxidoreductase subunit I